MPRQTGIGTTVMIRAIETERIAEGVELRTSTGHAECVSADDGLGDQHQRHRKCSHQM